MKKRHISWAAPPGGGLPWCGGGGRDDRVAWRSYAIVCAVAAVSYVNGLAGEFVHDDIPAIVRNRDVLAIDPLHQIFRNDFWGTPMHDLNSHKSYRPLTTLTFRANCLLFGLQPAWFHATNVALHVIASVLFTRVCLCIAGLDRYFAAAAGLLFAVHPIHTEAVTGIVGRADVLACVFFLISLLSYHGHVNGRCNIWTSIVLGGLSMLAKETGVTVFIVNLLYDIYRCWPFLRKSVFDIRWNEETCSFALRASKLLISLGLLLTLRLAILQGSFPKFSPQDNPTAFNQSIYIRFLTFSYLAAFNWWLLLCPSTLSHDWQMGSIPLVTSITDTRNLVTFLFFGCALFLTYKTIVDFEQQRHVPLVVGLLLMILPFLPATNLLITVGFVVAERVLYIPSMGCVLLVVYGFQILWNSLVRHRQTIFLLGIMLLVVGMLKTIARNRDWHSRENLLRSGLSTLPHNAKMHYNFANFLRDTGKSELAMSHYQKSLQLWPSYASAYNNLGTLMKDTNMAEKHFLTAISYFPSHINAHYNLGQIYRKTNQTGKSLEFLQRCIKLEPRFTLAYLELIKLFGEDYPKKGIILRKVVKINPKDPHHTSSYAEWLQEKGFHILSLKYYLRAMSHAPSYQPAMLGASKILRLQGRYSQLFQLTTRWHSVLRLQRGEMPINPHVYLHGWLLKTELSSKARAYDPEPAKPHCITETKPVQLSTMHQHKSLSEVLHPVCNRTKSRCSTIRQTRTSRENHRRWQHKRSTSSHLIQNLLEQTTQRTT